MLTLGKDWHRVDVKHRKIRKDNQPKYLTLTITKGVFTMSVNITTSFVEQYSANVSMLAQQTGSKLRGAVDVENVRGKNAFFD